MVLVGCEVLVSMHSCVVRSLDVDLWPLLMLMPRKCGLTGFAGIICGGR